MKRTVIQMRSFSRILDYLIKKNKISKLKFEEFEKGIVEDPSLGDLIRGSGGIRKARLSSVGKGKSGSFRVIYFDYPSYYKTYLIALYEKNFKENISQEEIKELKALVEILKREAKHG